MSNFNKLKQAIEQAIKQNGNGEITGDILQSTMLSIIDALLGGSDTTNMLYRGLATPETNPGSDVDEQVFYIASKPGSYINFLNLDTVIEADNKIHIIYNDINSDDWFEEALDLVEFIPILKAVSLIGSTTISIGTNNKIDGVDAEQSLAVGKNNTIKNSCCLAEGNGTTASGANSHTEGNGTTASGANSHTEGNGTTASGDNSHAEGDGTTASGDDSHAEGFNVIASDINSHAEGNGTTASGANSHAEGNGTTAKNSNSHAEGFNTMASGINSHAEGDGTTASGINSHAEGSGTIASSTYSHAEGLSTTASGSHSHAEGRNTIASGLGSHAEGSGTTASGNYSHAAGFGTTAPYNNLFVCGKYNFPDITKAIFTIGCGTSNESRVNALVVLNNGQIYIKNLGGYEGKNITQEMKSLQDIIQA